MSDLTSIASNMQKYVDFHVIDPSHSRIHERLMNWARWVKVRPELGWKMAPFWKLVKWEKKGEDLVIRETCDILDAETMEKIVRDLPEPNRTAIRWWYVKATNPRKAAQALGLSLSGLSDIISQTRSLLCRGLHGFQNGV